ncbi:MULTISPECIES: alpha/beta hydrolase [unclassified Bradyrhizobium]|uniref:alpha/beta fold hydrolase n=1 Tax=unclassified Bradyrhizobium TaxID=2631580 RepID=UPI001FFBE1B1|nr:MULTISPECIES: alpha/beta hydrolase [unclassified Bradyrhizobium]MCK1344500.1 alpha/beta hydrolase [Bradyrhizobium sp. CW11]MCK1591082.1 alpha/beta hydrolase [Bradyrhizobium sp. 169]
MFEGFEKKTAAVDGLDISCVIGGSGPPALLLHGFPQNKAMWARVAPLLATEFTVVCADLRGYGDSAKPPCAPDRSNYSFRAMAADQLGLMEKLGYDRFHTVGHDRGGRTAHRMALDHPRAVASLTVMDIVPTYAMFMDTNRRVAASYWHWYFLSQPEPFPERLIGNDPDFFYETCLVGWGATKLSDFDPKMLSEYRRSWREKEMIHGSCSDYRAAASIDLEHDAKDIVRKVACPSFVLYGGNGQMAQLFDIPAEWRKRCTNLIDASLPGGHFFVDQFPEETSKLVASFIRSAASGQ